MGGNCALHTHFLTKYIPGIYLNSWYKGNTEIEFVNRCGWLYLRNVWFFRPFFIWCQSQSKQSLRILGLVLVFCILFIPENHAQVKELSFDRIVLELPHKQMDTINQIQQKSIDSIFGMAAVDLMEFERVLGYKLSGQLHLRLIQSAPEYQSALQQHPIWLERYQSQYMAVSSNHFPIFVGATFDQIRIQLRYVIAYFTLNEFLNGSSIRQKMTQSGYHHFPSWLSQGFCAYWSNGWNIRAKDEFDYFQNKGAFPSPNQIEPMSAQTYGRYIWSSWIKEFGTSAITNFWFVLKYTGHSSSAIEFVVGESFSDWYADWKRKNIVRDGNTTPSDIDIAVDKAQSPILDLIRLGKNQGFLYKLFVPDMEVWALESSKISIAKKQSSYIYRSLHAKLMPEATFYLTTPIPSVSASSKRKMLILTTTGNTLFLLDTMGQILKVQGVDSRVTLPQFLSMGDAINSPGTDLKYDLSDAIFQHWGFSYRNSFTEALKGRLSPRESNIIYPRLAWAASTTKSSKDSTAILNEYYIEKRKIGTEKSMMSLIKQRSVFNETLWSDTVSSQDDVDGLIIESKDIISHIQSFDNKWFINFSKINDSSLIRWKIPLFGGFANQQLDRQQTGEVNIVELGFSNNKNAIRWIDITSFTATDIIEMKRKYETTVRDSTDIHSDLAIDTLEKTMRVDTWTYVSPYPKKDLSRQRSPEGNAIYTKGMFSVRRAKSSIGLEKGGIALSNEEPGDFPNVSSIDPNSLYNHPLTPELRFYLSNPRWGHTLKAGILTNLPMSRMAVRMIQHWKIGDWQIGQHYYHRSRDYTIRETTLFQNLGDQLRLEALRNYWKVVDLGVAVRFQRDLQFQKVNGPFSALKPQGALGSKTLILFGKTSLSGRNLREFYRAKYNFDGQIAASQFSFGNNIKDMGYHLQFHGTVQKQLESWMSVRGDLQLNASLGNRKTQFWIGGSEGWISPTPWDLKHQGMIDSRNVYAYRRVGGYVRGFQTGERLGHSSAVTNVELAISPYGFLHKNLSKSILLQQLQFYGFLDAGTAFIGSGLGSPENPFNLVQFATSNYRADVFAQRNPWIVGTGFGVRSTILKMPIRYEVAWGLKEGKILAPIQHVCMTWIF